MAYTFISGATGGIGSAFCREMAMRGKDLFLTARNIESLKALSQELKNINKEVKVEFFACDLTDQSQIQQMLLYIDGLNVKFENIFNVAGVDIQKAFLDYTYEKVLFQIDVNVKATITLTHQLIKRRADGEKLGILTVSSLSGVSPMPYFALYSATKCCLTNFFTSLHYELRKDGVLVTTVLPGGVFTRPDIIEDIKNQGLWGKLSSKSPEFVVKKSLKALKKNKITYIPGFFNRLLNFLMKLAPKKMVLSFIAKRWKKQTKDAF